MTGAARPAVAILTLALCARAVAAQEFQPPGGGGTGGGRLRVDLLAFSSRGGVDASDGKWIIGTSVDIVELWSQQVRFRPSLESGADGGRSLHLAGEIVYRFQPDGAQAIPYVGAGVGYFDDQGAGGGTDVWPTLVMGFELSFRPSFNWLLEYHALDRLGRHRFLVGLATRGATGGN